MFIHQLTCVVSINTSKWNFEPMVLLFGESCKYDSGPICTVSK